METPYRDRFAGGAALAQRLTTYANRPDVLILALPRGGVPVGYVVAERLHLPLDVLVVRKIGVPGHEELAMGAIGPGGICILDERVIDAYRIPRALITAKIDQEQREIARRNTLYRNDQPPPIIQGKTILLVDDGLATGSSMRAAISVARSQHPARIIVGAPVGAPSTCADLAATVDEVVCVATPEPFHAVGLWYRDFPQTTDAEVTDLLARARSQITSPPPENTAEDHPW